MFFCLLTNIDLVPRLRITDDLSTAVRVRGIRVVHNVARGLGLQQHINKF